jgi:hypothetical protein
VTPGDGLMKVPEIRSKLFLLVNISGCEDAAFHSADYPAALFEPTKSLWVRTVCPQGARIFAVRRRVPTSVEKTGLQVPLIVFHNDNYVPLGTDP